MKKLKSILALIFAPAIAYAVAIYSADEVTSMLATITGITTLTPLIVEPLKQILRTKGWYTRIMSGIIVYLLSLSSWWFGYGFEAYDIIVLLITSALMTLSVWGYISVTKIKMLLAIIVNNIDKIREINAKSI